MCGGGDSNSAATSVASPSDDGIGDDDDFAGMKSIFIFLLQSHSALFDKSIGQSYEI